MRLKEINPGMVIHCKTEDEAKELFKNLDAISYRWNKLKCLTLDNTRFDDYKENTCYRIKEVKAISFRDSDYFKRCGCEITEFSDLILPELTAEEALTLYAKVCKNSCTECPLYEVDGYRGCEDFMIDNPSRAIELLLQWKSNHEKKEPEIETVDICRIIEIQPIYEKLEKKNFLLEG